MSTPYISTAIVGSAHKSDILGVSVCKKFTVSCSSDGTLKLWDNTKSTRDLVHEKIVDKIGLHHVEVFEQTINKVNRVLVACVSFSGVLYLYEIDGKTNELVDLGFNCMETGLKKKTAFWAPVFDYCADEIILACTTVAGSTKIFNIEVEPENSNLEFKYKGELFANDTSIATCICSDINNNRMVVGHQNGNTYLYDFKQMVLAFNFESYGMKTNKSLNIVRSLKLSPNNSKYLAIASDSGPFGTISLYDVKFGEYLGSFKLATHSSNVGIGNFAHSKWCLSIDFNHTGEKLVSCGFDNSVRVWDVESRTSLNHLPLSSTDMDDEHVEQLNDLDSSACVDVKFVQPGIFKEEGQNSAITVVGFDRSIRWFREAGGI